MYLHYLLHNTALAQNGGEAWTVRCWESTIDE